MFVCEQCGETYSEVKAEPKKCNICGNENLKEKIMPTLADIFKKVDRETEE